MGPLGDRGEGRVSQKAVDREARKNLHPKRPDLYMCVDRLPICSESHVGKVKAPVFS